MENSKISVVFFRTAYDTGGGGSQMLLRLLKGINKEKFDIILLSQKEDGICKRAREHVSVEIIPYPGILDTYDGELLNIPIYKQIEVGVRILQYDIRAREVLNEADIIWCDGIRSFLTLFPYILLTNKPSILNIGLLNESKGVMKQLHSVVLATTDHVFIESEYQAKQQLTEEQYEKYRDKITVFHKGIDVTEFNPNEIENGAESKQLTVGTAALINPRKGLEYFIEAASLITDHGYDAEFLIAGHTARESDEEYKDRLEQMIRDEGIDNRVHFVGWVDDMPRYLCSLDVFVLPSLNEGIPGAVREALAMEVPVVATDVGGTAEAVIDGETGYLVEPEDSKALAATIEQLLRDPEKRRSIGIAGRQRIVEEFSVEQYVRTYEEFLSQVA